MLGIVGPRLNLYTGWTELKSFDGGRSYKFETDMSAPDDANWGNGEPNGGASTVCTITQANTVVYRGYKGGFALNDVPCSDISLIFCECKEFN